MTVLIQIFLICINNLDLKSDKNNKKSMQTSQNEYHYLFKVVLVGNSAVGKSSIVLRYADD